MNSEEKDSFIRFLAEQYKAVYRELLAYQVLAHTEAKSGTLDVDEVLDAARRSSAVEEKIRGTLKNLINFCLHQIQPLTRW